MGLRQQVAEITEETDQQIRAVAGGRDLATLQVIWGQLDVDDRVAILTLLTFANNKAMWAIAEHLDPPASKV